ncbi:MAG TPA: NAD(P)H-binding protein [Solirubrobacteraceae bacterium]|nr:NAD(P)H-binding protein [Solirubrobacteraceae bacterium]
MRILLTGASGFVGSALLPRLLEQGHDVRALARNPVRVRRALDYLADVGTAEVGPGDFELIVGDTLTGAGVLRAMRDADVAYYLIHSMEPAASGEPFPARERISAQTFANAARAARVQRIVYLGGPRAFSAHLASRYEVERILLAAVPDSVALRASVVIGARSRSFRFLVRLIERLRVLALPAWRRFRIQPIDERDIVEMLLACANGPAVSGHSLDAAGPDVLSYGEIVRRIAELMMLARPSVGLGVTLTPIAGRLAAALAGESPELVLPLMEGLTGDLLPVGEDPAEILGVTLHSFDAAVEHALHEWEKVEELAAR